MLVAKENSITYSVAETEKLQADRTLSNSEAIHYRLQHTI
jgi:hypothetical protein